MPIPFDMIAMMLFLGFYVRRPDASPPALPWSALILAGFAAGLTAGAYAINRVALAFAAKRARRPADRRQTAAVADIAARIVLVLLYALALVESSLPWSLARASGLGAGDVLVPQMAGILAYFLFFACCWLPLYGLHRELTPGRWSAGSYLLHKARYNLYTLIAWIPFALLSEWLSEILIVLPLLLAAAVWTFPYVLAKFWGCKPVQSEEIRSLVADLERRTKASFSKALIWEPGGGGMQNAAAVGIFPPFRYLFLTPALVANMTREELRGVILHELGHVKKRHLLLYMVTTLASANAALILGELLPLDGDTEVFAVVALLLLFYFRFVFGWMSRTMERQADLFALETDGSAAGLIRALERLGVHAGNVRQVYSWHHLGIAERTAFLRRAEANPLLGRRHNARARAMAVAGYASAAAMALCIAFAAWEGEASSPRLSPPGASSAAHWRRVMRLLPQNAVGPLELAYRLASDPASRGEAVDLAAKAMSLAHAREERDAAAKLIEELTREAP